MEGKQQRILLSDQLKNFVSKNLEAAGKKILELTKKLRTMSFKEELESELLGNISEVMARFLISCEAANGAQRGWLMDKIIFNVLKGIDQFDLEKINLDIEQIMPIEIRQNHGLSNFEPLDYASIIRACFSNPDRKKYPRFLNNRIPGCNYNLYTQNENPEYWLNVLNPKLIKDFNDKKIFLTDISKF